MKELTGPEFLALAYRAPAYGGSLAARMQNDQEPAPEPGRRVVTATRESVLDEGLAGMIDFG
jgi:hypothetical protein